MFDDVYLNPSEMELASLEIMTYLKEREIEKSEQIQSLSGNVTVKNGSERTTFDLFGFESKSMTVTKEELKNIEIEKVDGNIGIYVDATGGVEAMMKNQVDDFSIERSYSVGSDKTNVFTQSDMIKVTIDPTISKDEHRTYEITDFIPAGFRFIKVGSGNFWYEEQGQKMIFYYWSSENRNGPITYYIQAVMPGTYTADHAVIIKSGEVGTNYTEQETLIIE